MFVEIKNANFAKIGQPIRSQIRTKHDVRGDHRIGCADSSIVVWHHMGNYASMKKLAPCPFCGSTDLFVPLWDYYVHVVCGGCGCAGPHAGTADSARMLWNRWQEKGEGVLLGAP